MIKEGIFILLFTASITSQIYSQNKHDVFKTHVYHTNSWTFNAEGSLFFEMDGELASIYKIQIQHFPLHPKMYGDNILSIDLNISLLKNDILQFSLGSVCAFATWGLLIPTRRQANDYYDELIKKYPNMNEDDAMYYAVMENPYFNTRFKPIESLMALMSLTSAGLHFPFGSIGDYFGCFINWDLVKFNLSIKEKDNFISGNAGFGLHCSPLRSNNFLIKLFSNYEYLYQKQGSLGFTLGLSIGYHL